MKFSTANWLTIILAVIAAVSISIYFYLDANDMMFPLLAVIIKPLMIVTLLLTTVLLLANIMASKRKEERITRHHFLKAFVIILCLFMFRLIVSLA